MKLLLKLLLSVLLIVTTINASEQTPTQEEVAKLYVATFNRAPDSAGLSYWINNSGLTLSGIARSFFVQPETQALYPAGTTVKAFIQSVYHNLFNRAPDSAGLSYWEDDFNLRGRTRDSFILAMINGAQDNAKGMDKTILNNKNEVGLYFANAGLGADDFPTEVMSGVTADNDTVTFIKGKIDSGSITATVWNFFNPLSRSVLKKTGQTTSYAKYDDGYYQKGQAPRYTRASNSVTDELTHLIWQDDATPATMTWSAALTYCNNLSLGSHTDWRLPTIKELVGLSDYGRYSPGIDPKFQNTAPNDYWSSTNDVFGTGYAWVVWFYNGIMSVSDKTSNNYVRCVRIGK